MPLADGRSHSALDRYATAAKPYSQVTLTIHAVFVTLYALFVAFVAWFPDVLTLGRALTAREGYINNQADDVVWWALSTALAALLLRFAPRWSIPAILVWIATLLNTRPWGTPPPPVDASDLDRVTAWSGWFLPALVALFVLLGLRVVQRADRPARLVAAGLAVAVVSLLSYSAVVIRLAERSEQPFPTDYDRITLHELEVDPFWGTLDQSSLARQSAKVGTRTPWGEEPSELSAQIPTENRPATFDDLLRTAKETGWEQISIYCKADGTSRKVLLQKQLPSSPATATIREEDYSSGVHVRIRAKESGQVRDSDNCPLAD